MEVLFLYWCINFTILWCCKVTYYIRKDNPNVLDIVAEFSNTVAMFRVKPNSHD